MEDDGFFEKVCADCPFPEKAIVTPGECVGSYSAPIMRFIEVDIGDGVEIIGGQVDELKMCRKVLDRVVMENKYDR